MTNKKIRLKVVKVIPKEWESPDTGNGFGKGRYMNLFPLNIKGIYHMVKQRGKTYLTFERSDEIDLPKKESSIWSFPMYEELIDNLKNGGSIVVDETVLEIKDL